MSENVQAIGAVHNMANPFAAQQSVARIGTSPPFCPFPPEIAKAIILTSREAGRLIKDQHNQHAGYNFVGIDTYYERVAAVAAKHGLTWVASEEDWSIVEGAKNPMLRVTYRFSMIHESGVAVHPLARITLLHGIQGAQTVGSAVSYLDKIFMRQVFKLVTGERTEDADHSDPRDVAPAPPVPLPPPPPPPPPPLPASETEGGKPRLRTPTTTEQAELISGVFEQFVGMCRTVGELKQFWTENTAALEALEKLSPPSFAAVKRAFTTRRTVLETSNA